MPAILRREVGAGWQDQAERLDAGGVADVDGAVRADGDAARHQELAVARPPAPPGEEERAVGRELLHPIVAGVDDIDVARRVEGDVAVVVRVARVGGGEPELTGAGAGRPPRLEEG